MAEAATAYGCGGVQIGHSARGIVGLAAQMCRVAERGNKCVARIVRLGGHAIAPSREPTERWNARGRLRIRLCKPHDSIKFYKFPIRLASGHLRFTIVRAA